MNRFTRGLLVISLTVFSIIPLQPLRGDNSTQTYWVYLTDVTRHGWYIWCSDLVDWTHYHTMDGVEPPSKSRTAFHSSTLDSYKALFQLCAGLGVIREPPANSHEPKVAKPWNSTKAQQRFLTILTLMKAKKWPYYYRSKINEVEKVIQAWEQFPNQFPKDRFLSGYARLYANVLRFYWFDTQGQSAPRFEMLEKQYGDTSPIAIMASWYRALALLDARDQKGIAVLSNLAHRYHQYDWWVVHASQQMAKEPDILGKLHLPHQVFPKTPWELVSAFLEMRNFERKM